MPEIEIWEPEESIGKIWHSIAAGLDAAPAHPEAAVALEDVAGRIAVLFRGLGGDPAVEIAPAPLAPSPHRLSFRRRLGTPAERLSVASYDGVKLRLPAMLDAFPDRALNADLYLWLAASAAHTGPVAPARDPLAADLARIAGAETTVAQTLAAAPGLRALHHRLCQAALAGRPDPARLPALEAAVERRIRSALGAPQDDPPVDLSDRSAPRRYRPFRPVPLWVAPEAAAPSAGQAEEDADPAAAPAEPDESGRAHRARRRNTDRVERRDSLILHKFEAILSWADFVNINRRVEDDDLENARKAADDMDEIALGRISKSPATRLKLHLDLSPADADRERLSGTHLYPEWDHKTGGYLADHCRVLASRADMSEGVPDDPAARRRIRAVRRRFEALAPRRVTQPRQIDGEDLDLDAAVATLIDLRATGRGSDRIWSASRNEARDLAVSILIDASRSTESAVTGRPVIDIAREALTAFAWGIEGCGDDCAIHAFSSLRRDRVFVQECKQFDEPMGRTVEGRIWSLRPGFYTRLGAAIRHVSAELARRERQRRLLLVITDGKPNDLDHYEGRHGIEDSRMAITEARRRGQAVYGIAIEAGAKAWFPRLFGRGGYTVIPHPDRLTDALPGIYRQLVGA